MTGGAIVSADRAAPARAENSPEAEVRAALDAIHDPCSMSIGRPIGLVGMGIIDRVDVDGSAVTVSVLPTFPDCMFRTVFEEKIEQCLAALPWCRSVTVRFCPSDQAWDESRMSPEALRMLGRRRRPAGKEARR
jgi:metal-sulfur cluster biosynthetic enzyme